MQLLLYNTVTLCKKITSRDTAFPPCHKCLEKIKTYNTEKFLYCEDYDLYLNLITQGKKLANLNENYLTIEFC